MRTTLTDILDTALIGQFLRVGRDRKYRHVEFVMLAGDMLHLRFTDGHTAVAGQGTKIEFEDDGGGIVPPRR